MDLFSLEDDDASALFITQEPRKVDENVGNFDIESGFDWKVTNPVQGDGGNVQKYSDISDAE